MLSDRTTLLLSLSLSYAFSPFRAYTRDLKELTFSPFSQSFCFFHIMITHNRLSPQLCFFFCLHSTFLFKVFIHFDFILHSSLFLIFLPRPLYSCLQHPAMQTQPVLRGSELLKWLLPFPLCRSWLQRKD